MRVCVFLCLLLLPHYYVGTATTDHRLESVSLSEAILEIKKSRRIDMIVESVMYVESRGDAEAYNETEQAAGVFQIRPIMVREVNRLLGVNRYSLSDRWDTQASTQMFKDYQNIVNPEWDVIMAAKKWNGGINGDKKQSTIAYSKRVERIFEALKHGKTIN